MRNPRGFACAFIHLGNSSPNHLFTNIQSFRTTFPEIDIIFIGDCDRNLSRAKSLGVEVFEYSRSGANIHSMPKLSAGFEFRNGFWHYTLERLYAFADWHHVNPEIAALHLESDLILMPSFPFERFLQLKTAAWPRVNASTDMAGLLYSPNYEITKWLIGEVSRELTDNPALNDMTVLNRISTKHAKDVAILPTWSKNWGDENLPVEYSALEEHFGGVFDAASLGTWLTGQDPRNHWGQIRRFEVFSDYLLNFSNFQFSLDSSGYLLGVNSGGGSQIFNLHVHSKEAKYFRSDQRLNSVAVACKRNENPLYKNSFQTKGFLFVIRGYLRILFSREGVPAICRTLHRAIHSDK